MTENILYQSITHRYDLILHKLSLNTACPPGTTVSITFKIGPQITESKKNPSFFNKELYFTEILTLYTTTLQDNERKNYSKDKNDTKLSVFLLQNQIKRYMGQIPLDISKVQDEITIEKSFYITSENKIEFEGKISFTVKKTVAHISPSPNLSHSNISLQKIREKTPEYMNKYSNRYSRTPTISPDNSPINFLNKTTTERSFYPNWQENREIDNSYRKLTNKIENQENSIEMLKNQINQLMQTVNFNSNLKGIFDTPKEIEKKKKKNYIENETTFESNDSKGNVGKNYEKIEGRIKQMEEIKNNLSLQIKKKDDKIEKQEKYIKELEELARNLKNKLEIYEKKEKNKEKLNFEESLESIHSEKLEDFNTTNVEYEGNFNEKIQINMLNDLLLQNSQTKSKIEEKNRVLEERNRVLEEKNRVLEEKFRDLEENNRVLEEYNRDLEENNRVFEEKNKEFNKSLTVKNNEIQRNDNILKENFEVIRAKNEKLEEENKYNKEMIEKLQEELQKARNINSKVDGLEKHRDNLKMQLKQREVKFIAMEEKIKEYESEMFKKEDFLLKNEEKMRNMENEIAKANKKLGDALNIIFEEGNTALMEKLEKMLTSKYNF